MADQFPTDYEMVKCDQCGTMNSVMLTHCRKCDADMSKAGKFSIPTWVAAAVGGFIVIVTSMAIISVLYEEAGLIFGATLVFIGSLLITVGYFWFLFVAFTENILWGIGMIFLFYIVGLGFLFYHMDKALKPLAISVAGYILIAIGVLLIPGSYLSFG
ncbi:MAG: hypothetical protein GY796_02885 [Chloroflexi bacterium]|nr:hypothetical protein [Chloroflexota bacterium]